MGTLGTLGAIVPTVSKRKMLMEQARCELFLKCVILPMNIFPGFKFLRQLMQRYVLHSGHIFVDTMSTIIFSCLGFLYLYQYNNVLRS